MEGKKKATQRMKFNKSNGSPATKTSNQAHIHPADTGKVESTIADVLKNTKVIENYLDENNILPKSNKVLDTGTGMPSDLNSNKELADYLIQDADFLQRISAIMLKTILENDIFKQSIYDAMALEYEKKNENLEKSIESIRAENLELKKQIDSQEQYSRRNLLIFHGIAAPVAIDSKSKLKENTDRAVINFVQKHLQIDLQESDIDRSHRLGRRQGPIIAKFCHHDTKNLIFFNKKLLKNKNYLITESLPSPRVSAMKLLKKMKEDEIVNSYWSIDGKIYNNLKSNPEEKMVLCPFELDELLNKTA